MLILEDHVDPADAVDVLKKSASRRNVLQLGARRAAADAAQDDPAAPQRARARGERRRGRAVVHLGLRRHAEETPYSFDIAVSSRARSTVASTATRCSSSTTGSAAGIRTMPRTSIGPRSWRDRVEECEEERNRRPNIIAVDFYTQGDLLDVVDWAQRRRLSRLSCRRRFRRGPPGSRRARPDGSGRSCGRWRRRHSVHAGDVRACSAAASKAVSSRRLGDVGRGSDVRSE